MEMDFVKRFDEKRDWIRDEIVKLLVRKDKWSIGYIDIVEIVVRAVNDGSNKKLDVDKIHVIDDGDYQGTLVFVIPEDEFWPHDYWYIKIDYGSCSVCDTLQGVLISDDFGQVVNDLFTLSLHIVQNLKKMDDIVQ